jgi:threonine dehydrogenase-like Zn-dependent dehydrogenase
MKSGDVVGHEFMGEVVEVGSENRKLKVGDRVVVPFTICCGDCEQCRRGNWSVCERTNRKKDLGDLTFGHTTAGLFGYTHLTGGYAGRPGRVRSRSRMPTSRRSRFPTA